MGIDIDSDTRLLTYFNVPLLATIINTSSIVYHTLYIIHYTTKLNPFNKL